MTGPAISVVLPVHNAARYLAESLDSLAAQSFADFEIIAVDDGSTDGSLALLRQFAAREPRMRVVAQERRGVAHALNRGWAEARGALIARMDADDRAVRDRLALQHRFMAQQPEVVLVGSAVRTMDAAGRTMGHDRFPRSSGAIARALWAGRHAVAHPAVMMRRAALTQAGGYDPRFEGAEDYELWLRMLRLGPFHNLARPLLDYRVHSGGVTASRGLRQPLLNHVARAEHRGAGGSGEIGWETPGRLRMDDPSDACLIAALGLAALRGPADGEAARDLAAAAAAWLGPDTPSMPEEITVMALGGLAEAGRKDGRISHGLVVAARTLLRGGRRDAAARLIRLAVRAHPLGLPGLGAMMAGAAVRRLVRYRIRD